MLAALSRIKISKKLPVIMIGLTALNVFAVTSLQQNLIYKEMTSAKERELGAYNEAKKSELQGYLQGVDEDIATLAASGDLKQALTDFNTAWSVMPGSAPDRRKRQDGCRV